jgi:hypothetical protein
MAIVKRPPDSVSRRLAREKPVGERLDDYCKFVDCTPDYLANFALAKTLARAPGYRKWQAVKHRPGPVPVEGIGKRSQ